MKRFLTSLGVLMLLTMPLVAVSPVFAASATSTDNPTQEVCNGIGLTSTSGGCGDNGAQFASVMTNIINLLLIIIGVVAVVMIIIAGFNFITSGGDSNKVAAAKSTIIYAVIGLIVVAFAEIIVHFVIGTVTK